MKSRQDIFATLSQILIEDFEVEQDDLTLESHLYEDLDLDSIDAVDLVVKLRELTGKKIEPEAFKQVRTVEDVVRELEALVAA
ncbi:acyl carrier protein [Lacimicrobium sp. SS2-24]|uniref:acyl carrier protein n=1 Tax=Lacimicrobium sp. SS2-24 TaxID=2005569 RepID=UPI000B4A99B1|nr:acyl carrier protein [Lacimicrobium sp. SS2-24]